MYDASAPAAPVITSATHPDQNAWYATSPATFSWTASDSVSAIDGYSWGFDSDPSGAPDYLSDGTVPSASYARPGDGDYYLHVRARNAVGLWGAVATYRVRWDTAAPSGTMMVDGGSEATSRTAAVANSAVSDLSPMTMRASTSGGATWTASVPYATTLGVTLPAGDGVKTVIVAYTDSAGNVRSLTDTITLDTAAPQGSFHLENDAVYTRSAAVTASASITDLTAVSMRYSLDSGSTWTAWEPFSAEKRLTLPAGDGAKLVLGQYLDAAGNLMQTSDGITLDTAAPTLDAESTRTPRHAPGTTMTHRRSRGLGPTACRASTLLVGAQRQRGQPATPSSTAAASARRTPRSPTARGTSTCAHATSPATGAPTPP